MDTQELQLIMREYAIPGEIEQWHGVLSGVLALGKPIGLRQWCQLMQEVTGDDISLSSTVEQEFQKMLVNTQQQFQQQQLTFTPCLPADDEPLQSRKKALCGWCDAFMFGVAAGLEESAQLPNEASEFLSDLVEISQMQIDDVASDDEFDFMEVVEYVRVGVMLFDQESIQQS